MAIKRSPKVQGPISAKVRAALYNARKRRLSRISSGQGGGAPSSPFTTFESFGGISPVYGGGVIQRNSAYDGPAIRVLNTDDGVSTQDVNFNNGVISMGDIEFTNFKVVRIYDQWGSGGYFYDRFTSNVQLVAPDGTHKVPRFYFNGTSNGLYTDTIGSDNPPWKVSKPVWGIGLNRQSTSGLRGAHGVNASYAMTTGLWHEYADLHWRWNDGSGMDWTGTYTNITDFQTAIGVCRNDGLARQGFYNGALASTYTDTTNLVTYRNQDFWGFGDKEDLGDPWLGHISELHIFTNDDGDTPSGIIDLHNAMNEVTTIEL